MKNIIGMYTVILGFLGQVSANDFDQQQLDEAIARSLMSAESKDVVFSNLTNNVNEQFDLTDDSDLKAALSASLKSYQAESPLRLEKDHQEKNDEAIARILAEENESTVHRQGNTAGLDAQLARSLHEELNKGTSLNFPPLKQQLAPSDIQLFNTITSDYKKIPFDMDVHKMIAVFGRPNYPKIKKLEEQYLGLTPTFSLLSFNQIKDGITKFLNNYKSQHQADSKNINTLINREQSILDALNLIEGYYKNPIDGETAVNLQEIFSHTYQMAHLYSSEYVAILCEKIAENKETNGGCHPGITGRLIGFYYKMVADAINAQLY